MMYIYRPSYLFDRFCLAVLNSMMGAYHTESFTCVFKIPFHFQLAGGTASMQQLKERLEKDLLEV